MGDNRSFFILISPAFYVPKTDLTLVKFLIDVCSTNFGYIILLFFSFNWGLGLKNNRELTRAIIEWNQTYGPRVGFVYQLEYGWNGLRLTVVPVPITQQKEEEGKGGPHGSKDPSE